MSDRSIAALRSELVQVAAVAVAMIEDLDTGVAVIRTHTGIAEVDDTIWLIMVEVHEERIRQDAKWGAQHHLPMEWLSILGKEYGEACKAANEAHGW